VTLTKKIRRYDDSWSMQADCVVGDEHGVLDFLARDEQIDKFKEGDTITVRNGHAKVLRETGRIKLIVDKWGKIEKAAVPVKEANLANNISAVEYELVPANPNQGGRGGNRRGGRRD
jgi:hypothetical protein